MTLSFTSLFHVLVECLTIQFHSNIKESRLIRKWNFLSEAFLIMFLLNRLKYIFSRSLQYQCSPLQEEASLRWEQCKPVYLPPVLLRVHNQHCISMKKYKTKTLEKSRASQNSEAKWIKIPIFFLKNGKYDIKRINTNSVTNAA